MRNASAHPCAGPYCHKERCFSIGDEDPGPRVKEALFHVKHSPKPGKSFMGLDVSRETWIFLFSLNGLCYQQAQREGMGRGAVSEPIAFTMIRIYRGFS